ncbi:MAG: LicD family protein [Erysipelotrichaceae bacterium]|nr:LicD family protein [Erysipelotrichaceae bacterium]
MTTLEQLHEVQLEIFDEFVRLCEKHSLHYVMMGGSCLGAVRHRGFIPWDDDIDVGLYRDDYNRLIEICKKELHPDFFFQHFETEPNTGFIFGKLRKNHTLMTEEYSSHIRMHQGIWIDIFPFDYVADDPADFQSEYHKVLFYRNLLIVKQGYGMSNKYSWVDKIKYLCVKPVTALISKQFLFKKLLSLMTAHNGQPTQTLFPYGCAWAEKERISKKEFFDTIQVDFENRKVNIFRDYDAYLTRMYGDYMKVPEDIDQASGHTVDHIVLDDTKKE